MSTNTRRPAREQALPPSEIAILATLRGFELYRRIWALYEAGWTLRAIGEAFTPRRSRSTVQSWVERGREVAVPIPNDIPVPTLATPPEYVPLRPKSPGIPPADYTRIQELAPIARKYRAGMSPRHKASLANEELTNLCIRLSSEGVTTTELAEAAGVTFRAMSKRLKK